MNVSKSNSLLTTVLFKQYGKKYVTLFFGSYFLLIELTVDNSNRSLLAVVFYQVEAI